MLGIQLNGGAICGFRLERLPGRPQQHAEIAVRIGMTRVDGDRLLIGVDRRLQLAGRLENDAEVVVAIRAARRERKAPLDERDGFVAVPLLMRQDARIVQRIRMIRRGVEHAAIQLPGFDELLIFLQQDSERDRLLERQLARRCFRLLHGGTRAGFLLPATDRTLALFVGLEVVLEMNPCIERPIGLLRLVFEVDLGKRQASRFPKTAGRRLRHA